MRKVKQASMLCSTHAHCSMMVVDSQTLIEDVCYFLWMLADLIGVSSFRFPQMMEDSADVFDLFASVCMCLQMLTVSFNASCVSRHKLAYPMLSWILQSQHAQLVIVCRNACAREPHVPHPHPDGSRVYSGSLGSSGTKRAGSRS